ncbi:Sterol regulatory element-binding protein ECM22 [Verticillium dahliae VDG2]|nr:Sterol regulatory element-binding protein ECM22 [Verticillium dahliae VDG2]
MKNTAALDMVDANVLLDFDSRYGYDETDQCLNSSATCRTANSMSSALPGHGGAAEFRSDTTPDTVKAETAGGDGLPAKTQQAPKLTELSA